MPDGRELPARLRWLLSSAVAWLGPPAAGAAARHFPALARCSRQQRGAALWGNPAGAEASRARSVALRCSSRLTAAAGADKSGAEPGCARMNCGAIIRNEFSGDGTAGAAGSLAQPELRGAWPGHSRAGTLAKPGASPSPTGTKAGHRATLFLCRTGRWEGLPGIPAQGWGVGDVGTPLAPCWQL